MSAVVDTLVEAGASALAPGRRAGFLRRLGTALGATGRAEEAVAHYRRSLAMLETVERPTPVNLYDMACCRSLIAGAATVAGSGLTDDDGRLEADRAVAGVRRALDAGYARLAWIRKDPDLDPIRSRPDFQLLMMDREFPDDPLAPADRAPGRDRVPAPVSRHTAAYAFRAPSPFRLRHECGSERLDRTASVCNSGQVATCVTHDRGRQHRCMHYCCIGRPDLGSQVVRRPAPAS